MPKTLPALDVSGVLACPPMSAGALGPEAALHVALRLKALADPVRVRILSLLMAADDAGICTRDLAPAVGLTEGTVSHHLRLLRESGFVEGTRDGAGVFYRAAPLALSALVRVIDPDCC